MLSVDIRIVSVLSVPDTNLTCLPHPVRSISTHAAPAGVEQVGGPDGGASDSEGR